LLEIYWRASLVPAAAVIPAPIAYTNVVAVKKLVVECPAQIKMRLPESTADIEMFLQLVQAFTVNKLECSKQAYA
jgi:hypothetical protein